MPQAGSRIDFAEPGVDDFDHEADDGARRVELAGVAGGVAHLAEHGLVEMAEGVDLVAAGEVDVADLVDHVAQQVAVDHPVDRASEHGGDDVAPVAAVGALQAAQVGEQPGAFLAVGPDGFFVVDEGDQLVAGDAVLLRRPVAPAVGRLDRRAEAFARHLALPARAICSMSSRNLRNMIQVSIGRRSRSPLSPLSLRMMSRQDLTMDESRCAVVRGCAFFCVRAIFPRESQIADLRSQTEE